MHASDYIKYLPQVLDILVPLLLVVLAWAAAEGARYVRTRTQAGVVQDALLRLDDAAFAVVSQIAQGTAAQLKEAAADGKLTPEEITAIKHEAYNAFLSYLGANGRSQMITLFGEDALANMIKAKIEQAVLDTKASSLDKKATPVGDDPHGPA